MRYSLTPIRSADERTTLDRIWAASQDADDRAFRPRDGWWSLSGWAARGALLLADGFPAGGLAVNRAPDGGLEARLALLPQHRTTAAARPTPGRACGLPMGCHASKGFTRKGSQRLMWPKPPSRWCIADPSESQIGRERPRRSAGTHP